MRSFCKRVEVFQNRVPGHVDFARHQRLLFVHDGRRRRLEVVVVNSFVSIDDVKAFFEEIEKEKKKRVLSYSSAA